MRKRYTDCLFPPYRYIPGKTPRHPESHPDKNAFFYGVDLFNHGYWWEAHEAWESIWLAADKKSPEGQYLQGFIQYSGAMLKCYQGERRGLPRLLKAATDKLSSTTQVLNTVPTSWLPQALRFAEKITAKDYAPPNGDPVNDADFPFIVLI